MSATSSERVLHRFGDTNRKGGEPRPVSSSVERAGSARDPCRGSVSGGAIKGPVRWAGDSARSRHRAPLRRLSTCRERCAARELHRGAISPPCGARSPCSADRAQTSPSADSRAYVSGIRPMDSSSPPKPPGQSRRLGSRLNQIVFRAPALRTGVDLEPIRSAERRNDHRQLHFDAASRAIGLPWRGPVTLRCHERLPNC